MAIKAFLDWVVAIVVQTCEYAKKNTKSNKANFSKCVFYIYTYIYVNIYICVYICNILVYIVIKTYFVCVYILINIYIPKNIYLSFIVDLYLLLCFYNACSQS